MFDATFPMRAHGQMSTQTMQATRTNPIDLTGDDEDDSAYANPGIIRSRAAGAASHNTIQLPFGGPTMAPAAVVAGQLGPPTYSSSSSSSSSPSYNRHNHSSSPTMATVHSNPYGRSEHSGQPGFGAPRTALPSGFTALPPNNGISPAFAAPGRSGTLTATNGAGRAVIDLTSSSTPSPPPHPHLQHQHQHPHPHQHGMTPTLAPVPELPPDLPLKTPICIGQLVVTALVLYPISYLAPSEHGGPDSEWACVRTQYEHNPSKPLASQETIHIKSPNYRTANGETRNGENFGVVEQKVATAIGPMLGKGLIRIEGRVRRGRPNLPILPLVLLVYTPKGNIQVVGNFLREQSLLLDHPDYLPDIQRLANCFYFNPHNPPPGGHARAKENQARLGYSGPGAAQSRWSTPTVSGKSVEVQRNQADELFKNLQTGDELPETEAPPEVKTKLYPHQKKAITFLLEREREVMRKGGQPSSLWTQKFNPFTQSTMWQHLVTSKEVAEEPHEAKGAILADDMGLGKTITTVSLLAATLDSATAFAAEPLVQPSQFGRRMHESGVSATHFAGAVWGMPDVQATGPTSLSAKQVAKANREADKQEAGYARAARLKVKSRGTLIVCPLSTISNWEDQFREHWNGPVTVVGGGGISCTAAGAAGTPASGPGMQRTISSAFSSMGPLTQSLLATESKSEGLPVMSATSGAGSSSTPSSSTTYANGGDSSRRPCRVYVYHGNARRPDPAFLADFDAVITTYSTLATEFSKQSKTATPGDGDDDESSIGDMIEVDELGNQITKPAAKKGNKRKKCMSSSSEVSSPLQSVMWFRIVLDEAHSIKETGTVACRACCDLEADRRLCLTGTPVQNKLDDLFALIKFLRLEPFIDKAVWTEYIGTPVKFGQAIGIARLQTIMKIITLRRTKESRAENGEKILSLPPRRDELRFLKFAPEEQTIYDEFFKESKSEFTELSKKNEVMKNYVGILQKILRLRQICDHYELVQDKGIGNATSQSWESLVASIAQEGLTTERASAIFAILRESASAQCVECGYELGGATTDSLGAANDECAPPAPKRGRKAKAAVPTTRQNSPIPFRPILTRCQHLFCANCYRSAVFPQWPLVPPDQYRQCSACPTALSPMDAVEVNPEPQLPEAAPAAGVAAKKKSSGKKEKRQKGVVAAENFVASTKIKSLMGDLIQLSKANPNSTNFDPASLEIEAVDESGNALIEPPTKTIVFSQWTTMLDKIEDALELANIRYERLDGTMRREERVAAMEGLKNDAHCEVLLVSLKAGGVGLNLTSASRVYLMDPYWNPAVEHQAVDRVHRLGQTRPVTTIKLVIENSIEDKLLKVQKRKEALANMTLGPSISKAEVVQRRLEELMQLFDS